MKTLAVALTALVALEHLGFLGLEMFAWTLPVGQSAFHTTAEFAASTAALAANQGLYNGFLAAGLAFALWRGDVAFRLFFLGCVWCATNIFGAKFGPIGSRPLLPYSIAAALLGAQALSLGLLAELLVAYTGRETDTFSVAERTARAPEPAPELSTALGK